MFKQTRSIFSDNSGASALEFAILAPVFLAFVVGILAYGIYFGAAHSTASLAAEAARASVGGITDAERVQFAEQHVEAIAGQYHLLDANKITVEAGNPNGDATIFRVTVSYNAEDLPIWGLGGLVPLPGQTIVRTASVIRGGF